MAEHKDLVKIIKDGKLTLSLEELDAYVIYKLTDNGDWEYTREGIGIYCGRTFIVDLDDIGEEERDLIFVREGMQVHDVLAAGKASGRYAQDDSGTFYYNWGTDGNNSARAEFNKLVGI